jgi:hypothetical protein
VEPRVDAIADGLRRVLSADGPTFGRRAVELIGAELSWSAVATSWIDQVSPMLDAPGRLDRGEPTDP